MHPNRVQRYEKILTYANVLLKNMNIFLKYLLNKILAIWPVLCTFVLIFMIEYYEYTENVSV